MKRLEKGKEGRREGGWEGGREGGKAYLSSILVKVKHEALGVIPAGGTHLLPSTFMPMEGGMEGGRVRTYFK